ncbi:MAG: hypothetical protein HON70_35005, partial [Lentisphaerae bacterium]|nr:hypothetical protein [Lentisphaerota bacterium]
MSSLFHLLGRAFAFLLLFTVTCIPCLSAVPADQDGQTWTQAMLAARAEVNRWRGATVKGGAGTVLRPSLSGAVAGDGPGTRVSVDVTGWSLLRLETVLTSGGGNCHIWGEAQLTAADGTVIRICDVAPESVAVGWGQLLRNKNWQDNPLRIGQRQFEHGIWVHSKSDVVYAVDGKYVRFDAWAGMDADRAKGTAHFNVHPTSGDPLPGLWARLVKAYPEQMAWLVRDAGRRRERNWFGDGASSKEVTRLIQTALRQAGPEQKVLQQQLDGLRTTKAGPEDPRWLDLYACVCRTRTVQEILNRIWLTDVRTVLQAKLTQLLASGAVPDDPRWKEFVGRLKPAIAGLPAGADVSSADLTALPAQLRQALPQRFLLSQEFAAALEACRAHVADCLARVEREDASALSQVPALCAEITAAREHGIRALRGMDEFLAVPAHTDLAQEWRDQYGFLEKDVRNRAHFERVALETYRPESLILATDRDPADVVLRRSEALLRDLQGRNVQGLEAAAVELTVLRSANGRLPVTAREARFVLYAAVCRVRRQIAFSNPLLDFSELLVLKRHRSRFQHMCDQYYGAFAVPGGGLYAISDPFGPEPEARNVLANSTVARGRLKGKALTAGSYLSPDLSFDGRQVAFAYTECEGSTVHEYHVDHSRGHWDRGRCYHIFKANVDGSGLLQLTDGTWNDFDPCWMPSGRLAFVSERRGGYLRCGRSCPTYTLFDMAADGAGLRCLSPHETNEWHPSVTHDGRIIWTRWDYVDRHGCVAHTPWITTADGSDPRPLHGNYAPRHGRPDMELDVRAVPSSHKYLATAAPHHGQAFGSLILIDPRVPDDDGMGPVKRVTPEVRFPETQGGREVYGSPWPLSDDYYLCAYDADMTRATRGGRGNYGIYLVDSFGNRELIYRDPEIASHNPIPLRPRLLPPAVPVASARPAEGDDLTATVGVMDVYNSSRVWPEGTQIKALRVYQILPLSVASAKTPHNTGVQVPQGSDSINLARMVLGTVPVEPDGSAHFTVPAGKELYFQALDEHGLAVTSMRSATHFQPGERAICHGCHEPRPGAPASVRRLTLATQRPPSRPKPDVDGTNPFSYPRLVQPVLDRHCVGCHAKNVGKAPALGRTLSHYPPTGRGMNKRTTYYTSYVSLAPKYGFYDYGGRGWSDP